jgi:hypothetical protein
MKYRLLALTLLIACFPLSASPQTPKYARVISQSANLRETPSVTGTGSLEITEDTLVKVLDEKLPWFVVRIGNRVGWMHGNTLEFINAQRSTAQPLEQNVSPIYTPSTAPAPRRDSSPDTVPDTGGYTRPDRTYIRGPRGGCYYLSPSGRKVYVDRSLCN